jgi:hypothetical protein
MEKRGIVQRQDRFRLAGGRRRRPGVVCAPSTLLQLHLVSDRRRRGHQYSKGGVPGGFSTFEPIELTPDSITQRAGVPMLYDSASNPYLPCLYFCLVAKFLANVVGCAPSFRASSAATVTPLSHTASRTIGVLDTPPLTRSGTGVTTTSSTR